MSLAKKILILTAILAGTLTSSAQSPAGISSGLKLWIRTDAPATLGATGGLLDSWTYANDNTKSFTATGTERPTLAPASLNFLPSLLFSGAQMMDGPTGANAPLTAGDDDYCLFVVWRSTSTNTYQRVWSQRKLGPSAAADGFALATWNTGIYGDQVEVPPYSHTVPRDYTTGAWNISHLNLLNQPLNDLEIADDRNLSTGILQLNTDNNGSDGAALRTLTDVSNRLGARDNSGEETLTGNIAELIIYDRPISATERSQIFSYLSLKYGIPINTDLLSSGGTAIWNSTTNATYNNAVFGIGKDDNAGLSLTQSNSILTGSGDGTGQSGAGNIILSNPSNLDNGEFLVVGNDNGALSETTSNLPSTATAAARRLGRQWKVQHTGNLGTIACSIDLAGITTTGIIGHPNDFRLMIDADGDGNFATGTPVFYNPASFTGSRLNFTGVTAGNNAVFTLVTLAAFTGNQSPTASAITSPAATAVFVANGNIIITATAADPDNNLVKMEFYQGTTKLGETTGGSPYTFTWTNVPAGTYSITAKAIDAGGLSFSSTALNIVVPAEPGWSLSGNAGTTPGNHFIGTTDNQRLVFKAGNTESMTILPNGNVGIGTTNPQALLAVNGDIFTKKIRITPNGWSDYVFEKDYRLPPLKEVAQFIREHHHLPDIQPAATVEKDGLDVGDHQVAILKKMEELTLYLIEQDKKIQQLTEKLEQQQATIRLQNARIEKLSGHSPRPSSPDAPAAAGRSASSPDPLKQSSPSDPLIPAHPDHPGAAHHMILRHKSPKPGILGIMPVITHHPIIIHGESIAAGGPVIEKDGSLSHLQLVPLINPDSTLVQGEIGRRQRDGSPPGRYP